MFESYAEQYAKRQLRMRSYVGVGMSACFVLFALFVAPALAKEYGSQTIADSFPTFQATAIDLVAPKEQTPAQAVVTPAAAPHATGRAGILQALEIEYAKHPREYDATVLMYTEGFREEWCADFVSYVYRQAGQPLSNPHNGSWRIPAVWTLRQYFESQGRFRSAYSYTPRPGDVAIYGGGHTNIVVAVDGDTMTTIGGNEYDTIYKDTISHAAGSRGLTGFGIPLE